MTGIEEIIARHRQLAWEYYSRGRPELAELHMSFAQELRHSEGKPQCSPSSVSSFLR